EYDFAVAAGADPRAIRLEFTGVESGRVTPAGDLALGTPAGEVVQRKPVVYQEVKGGRRPVDGRYRLLRRGIGVREYRGMGVRTAELPNGSKSKSRSKSRTRTTALRERARGPGPNPEGRSTLIPPHSHTPIPPHPIEVAFALGPYDRSRPLIID